MAVTPAVFFRFGRRAAERSLARDGADPLSNAAPSRAARSDTLRAPNGGEIR
jgi:hypothetical protein